MGVLFVWMLVKELAWGWAESVFASELGFVVVQLPFE
jgi:hypothetical protein